jgi:bacterioferritin (cytochrome b1)
VALLDFSVTAAGTVCVRASVARVDWVAERITQLGGIPNFNPVGLATRSHAEYVEAARIQDMIREDLIADLKSLLEKLSR